MFLKLSCKWLFTLQLINWSYSTFISIIYLVVWPCEVLITLENSLSCNLQDKTQWLTHVQKLFILLSCINIHNFLKHKIFAVIVTVYWKTEKCFKSLVLGPGAQRTFQLMSVKYN